VASEDRVAAPRVSWLYDTLALPLLLEVAGMRRFAKFLVSQGLKVPLAQPLTGADSVRLG
jgi:hypothetical protein